jgi:hypothetical protein
MSSQAALDRRSFLASLAAGIAAPALASAQSIGPAPRQTGTPVVGGKGVLTANDFTYIGSFKMPVMVNGVDHQYGLGLTHRYVNGELHFLADTASVYEVVPAALVMDPKSAGTARAVRSWGDVAGTDSYGRTFGIYWDDQSQKLFWANGNEYNTTAPYNPSIGYCTLDDSTGVLTRRGIWQMNGRSCKMTMGGVTAIPKWFADAYTNKRRLGAGFGGYFSIANTGPVSMGPALTAFDPAEMNSVPSRSAIANTPIIGYPFNGSAYSSPDRCHRDVDVINEYDGWDPRNGVGYWTWSDMVYQGGVWIDTPKKSGLLFCPVLGNGRVYYYNSNINSDRSSHAWFMYDPVELSQVATGRKQQWEVQPRNWLVQYPGMTYPLGGFTGGSPFMVMGVTWDATTQILYVGVKAALGRYAGSPTVVYAYKVT